MALLAGFLVEELQETVEEVLGVVRTGRGLGVVLHREGRVVEQADTFDDALNTESFAGGVYHTGDVVSRDEDGYLTYVGRADDVFKSSDYKISPFELESVLIEHPAVAEAAVVPVPDPVRAAIPKAYVALAAGHEPTRETALSIFRHTRENLAPFLRVRRIEFAELPKTISGKIRRVELRGAESESPERRSAEFREEDFPALRS